MSKNNREQAIFVDFALGFTKSDYPLIKLFWGVSNAKFETPPVVEDD